MTLLAEHALNKVLTYPDIVNVLDVGSGRGEHAEIMRAAGMTVTTNSLEPPADYVCDFLELPDDEFFDCLWCSHVLEHQPNPGLFLQKCFRLLRDDGLLAITVPPAKPAVVGGHVSLWNMGILLYHLILAGFDCRQAQGKQYGYNISVLVRKKAAELPELRMDCGDIERLAEFFPFKAEHGFNGEIQKINWK